MEISNIKLSQIEQNENSRMTYQEKDLVELMGSLKEHGLLQPIGVRKTGRGTYECIFGNRRLVAAEKLGWSSIAASVVDVDDDVERDTLNLVENIKRANITLAEEGRIYQMFIERKLTESEIAARVGVPNARVKMALKVFHEIPEEFHKKIVNARNGTNLKKGTVPAGTAAVVLAMRKSYNIPKEELKNLLHYASQDNASIPKLRRIGPLLQAGKSVAAAIREVDQLHNVQIGFLMERKTIERLEKKLGKAITEIARERLASFEDLGIVLPRGPVAESP